MPELGEVAHEVAVLQKYILESPINIINAPEDRLLYKPPLTSATFTELISGLKVVNVGRNGKYFWFEMSNSSVFLLHLGMTGWIHVKDVHTHYLPMESGGDKKQLDKMAELGSEEPQWGPTEWPPKFTKLEFANGNHTFAFTDPRRLARIRHFTSMQQMLSSDPVSKLGPDYSLAPPEFTDFVKTCSSRRVAVKSFLLDQSVFSGNGNWMSDEMLHLARIHPEQRVNTIPEPVLRGLYDAIIAVCKTTAEFEANTTKFPKNWLMLHRWGKSRSKKQVQKTPDGRIVDFITVGGRTSCYIPELQKLIKADDETKANIKDEIEEECGDQNAKRKSKQLKTSKKIKREADDVDDNESIQLNGDQKLQISKFKYEP